MSTHVHLLDDILISKIAAGEVVERPSSVIKELVENAIDARARHIHVDIQQGGRKSMTVLDDGQGMSREDAMLAIQRHATSKIAQASDLFALNTLGFRGEALPSMGSVSMMTLTTLASEGSEKTGTYLEIEGGKLLKTQDCAAVPGTKVVVENLFFNTPARLKFLKTPETEFSHIDTVVTQMALAHPEIGFQLHHNGKKALSCPEGQELRERVATLFGATIAEQCLPIAEEHHGIQFHGLVGKPALNQGTAKSLHFFVNGRAVKDRVLHHAVLQAYETLLMRGRYPWVFLFLEMPGELVDVNVHPAKLEVRFAQSNQIHNLVRQALKKKLVGGTEVAFLDETVLRATGSPMSSSEGRKPALVDNASVPFNESLLFSDEMASIKILGQVHGTYLLCELEDRLIFVDQHAAHERIGYEALRRQHEDRGIIAQRLLLPETFKLKPSQAEILRYYLEGLAKLGLEIDDYGHEDFAIQVVPKILERSDIVALVQDLVDSLSAYDSLEPLERKVTEVLETMACHQQVRAGDSLSSQEIWALLEEMKKTPRAAHCPHGRPVAVTFTFDEVEKWFKRKK